MAHGFLSPQEVTGESPLFGQIADWLMKDRKRRDKQLGVIGAQVEEIQNKLGAGQVPKLPPGSDKLLGGATTKLLMGSASSAIVPRKAGIVNTEAKNAIVGRNATNIDKKEQRYLGTTDPDVAGGPQTRKGGTFTDFGSTAQAKPLNDTNFFSKAVNEGIDANTGEYLSREARIAAFQKGKVARNPDQGPNLSPDSGADIVAAVNRNTEAIIALASLTKDQTSKQVSMHNEREARDERRANRALARAEERDLERGSDLSGYLTPEKFKKLPPAGGTGGGGGLFGGFDGGDVAKTLGRRLLGSGRYSAKGAQTAAKTAKALTGPKALLAASKLGVTTPAHIARMIGKNSGKISGIASRMVLGSTKAAPIVKTMVTGAKASKSTVGAIAGAATGAKAMQAGANVSAASKIAAKKGFSVKNFGEALEVDGIRQLGNVAATGDDAVDGAKMLARLVDEGVPKTEAARIVADQFPNAGKALKTSVTNSSTAKLASKALGKGIGKSVLKKIPVIAGLAGIAFGIQRAMEGDFLGAGLEIASGVMGATGVGAGASLAIDGFLLARDMGVTPFAQGGIITKPTMGLVGETGQAEGVFPLEGAQGRKTFEMFGNAFVDAQVRRKREVAQVQAEGLKLFSKDQEYMKVFDLLNPFKWGGGNDGGGNSGGSRSTTPMVGPPPPVSGGRRGGTPLNSTGAKGVLDVIASVESNGSYDVFNTARGGTPGKATEKTIGWLSKNAQGAIGRYQHMPEFILERAARFGYDANTVFTPEVQDDITIKMMQEQHGLDDFLSGDMSAATFAAKLAPTWRGLPQGQRAANRLGGTADSTYMDQYSSGNKAHMSWQDSVANFERIQAGAGKISEYDPNKKYKAGDMVIKNGEVREFDGMGWARPSGVSAQNFEPQASNPTTGTPLMATSAQVASASTASAAAAPTIINNYYSGGQQQNGVNPNGVTPGIGMDQSGTAIFQDLRIRSLA